MRVVFVILAILALAGCAPPHATADASPGATNPSNNASSSEEQACKARGGEMRRICLMGELACVEKYRDAGKACTDKSQCMGQCRYRGDAPVGSSVVGECQRTTDPCGCFGTVENGKFIGSLCVD